MDPRYAAVQQLHALHRGVRHAELHHRVGIVLHPLELQREARSLQWIDNLRLDLRDAGRSLLRNRRLTAVAVLIVATAGAINAAILGVADGVLTATGPVPGARVVATDRAGSGQPADRR